MTVVGDARDTESLTASLAATAPDAVLLDWELPGLNPRRHLAAFRADGRPWLVVLSSRPEAHAAAMRAGADAFVSKGDPPEVLLMALRAVCDGDRPRIVGGAAAQSSETTA